MNSFLPYQGVSHLLFWIGLISLFLFCFSLLLIPLIIGKLPQDYFIVFVRRSNQSKKVNMQTLVLLVVKNVTGYVLLLAGILMLFLPGQGILTIIVGALFINFPNKKKILTRIILKESFQKSLDWIRAKRGKASFHWPQSCQ